METKEKGEKKCNKKVNPYKILGIVLIYAVIVVLVYAGITKLHFFPVRIDAVCFSLYMGVVFEAGIWTLSYLFIRKEDKDAIQLLLQPFVLLATFWGYVLDIFGDYKNWAIKAAAVILTISFLIDAFGYIDELKRKEEDEKLKKAPVDYEVIATDEKGIENHYRITVKK